MRNKHLIWDLPSARVKAFAEYEDPAGLLEDLALFVETTEQTHTVFSIDLRHGETGWGAYVSYE